MADGTLKVGTITTSSGSGTVTLGQSGETFALGSGVTLGSGFNFTLSSTVATTSGTSVDFTGIPSTARLIIVNFSDYSKSGGNGTLIQLGTSSGFITSGYKSNGSRFSVGDAIMGRSSETALHLGFAHCWCAGHLGRGVAGGPSSAAGFAERWPQSRWLSSKGSASPITQA